MARVNIIVNTIAVEARNRMFFLAGRAFQALFEQKDRWGLWLPVPLAVGIAGYFSLGQEPRGPWLPMAVLVGALALMWRSRGRWSMLAWLCLATVALGFLAAYARTHTLNTVMLAHESGPVLVQGRVETVDPLPTTLRITLTDLSLQEGWLKRGDHLPRRVRIKLKAKDPADPVAGDIVQIKASLLPLSGPVAPGAFDFQRHAYFLGLGATGYALGELKTVNPAALSDDVFERLRHAIRKKIVAHIQDPDIAAIVVAFLIGESNGIKETTWNDIRRSGIAHLLAISGYHITVVAGAFFFLVRALLALWPWAALHWPIKKIAAVAAMGGAWFYLLLIGSPITAERSVVTACIVMFAIIIDRNPFSLRLAAFSAGLLLLFEPEILIGPSFQMSFAAVAALIAFYESVARSMVAPEKDTGFLQRVWIYLVAGALTTVIATIATAPYTFYHFGQVPFLSGLVTNLMAVPVSSVITLPFGIIACLLMPFGLEAAPLWVAEQSMRAIMWLVDITAKWPHTIVRLDSFSPVWLVTVTLGGLWICIWRGWWRWLGLLPVAVAVAGAVFLSPRAAVLVAENGRQVAIRDDNGRIWLSAPKREKFIAQAWLQREGSVNDQLPAGSWQDVQDKDVLQCDSKACIFTSKGVSVSLVTQPESMAEDCGKVAAFIAPRVRLDPTLCPEHHGVIIDERNLRFSGAYAVYIENGTVSTRNVKDERGVRPWTPGFGYQ